MHIITHGSILYRYNAQIAYGLIEMFIIIITIIHFVRDGLWEIIYHGKRIYLFMGTYEQLMYTHYAPRLRVQADATVSASWKIDIASTSFIPRHWLHVDILDILVPIVIFSCTGKFGRQVSSAVIV